MRRSRTLFVPAATLLVTGTWSRRGRVGPVEARVFRAVNRRSNTWSAPLWVVMQAGSLAAVGATMVAVSLRGDRSGAIRVGLIGTSVWAAVKLVKPMVGRARPAALLPSVRVRGKPQRGLGFPSGHAAVATTLALLTAPDRVHAVARAVAAGGLVGATRVHVGAHLPVDVVGGAAIGALAALATRPTTTPTGIGRLAQ